MASEMKKFNKLHYLNSLQLKYLNLLKQIYIMYSLEFDLLLLNYFLSFGSLDIL